jgi:hypothetical protein
MSLLRGSLLRAIAYNIDFASHSLTGTLYSAGRSGLPGIAMARRLLPPIRWIGSHRDIWPWPRGDGAHV